MSGNIHPDAARAPEATTFDGVAPSVRLDRDGAVARLTLNRPDAANAINLHLAQELKAAATECSEDRSIRAVLLRAEGRIFCAGGDIGAFVAAGPDLPRLVQQLASDLHAAIGTLARMHKPLVTAVQGAAAGAGFGLSLMGDIVLAARKASFSIAYPAIGLTPDAGATWILPRLVGIRRAQELALLNPRLSADEALEMGLITRVVDDALLDGASTDLAAQLANGPTSAYGHTRRLLLEGLGRSLEDQLECEARTISRAAGHRDGREGIAAFVAKRPPVFGQ